MKKIIDGVEYIQEVIPDKGSCWVPNETMRNKFLKLIESLERQTLNVLRLATNEKSRLYICYKDGKFYPIFQSVGFPTMNETPITKEYLIETYFKYFNEHPEEAIVKKYCDA